MIFISRRSPGTRKKLINSEISFLMGKATNANNHLKNPEDMDEKSN